MAERDIPVVGVGGMHRASIMHQMSAAAIALGLLAIDDLGGRAERMEELPNAPDPKAPDSSDIAAQMRAERARRKAEAFQKRQQK